MAWKPNVQATAAAELDSTRLTAVVGARNGNEGDVCEATEPPESADLLKKASAVFLVFREAGYLIYALHYAHLQEVGELHKVVYRESIHEFADFVLVGPT